MATFDAALEDPEVGAILAIAIAIVSPNIRASHAEKWRALALPAVHGLVPVVAHHSRRNLCCDVCLLSYW